MRVGDIMSAVVLWSRPSDPISRAATRMACHGVGSLLVRDGGELAGIITERDLVRAIADRRHPELTSVANYMTSNPVTVRPSHDSRDVVAVMLDQGIRHLPVRSGSHVVGTISARDLLVLESWPGEPAGHMRHAPAA
jgi:CBS domain-containing protein